MDNPCKKCNKAFKEVKGYACGCDDQCAESKDFTDKWFEELESLTDKLVDAVDKLF